MPFQQQKSTKKGPQEYLISRPNPISVILRMDVPLIRKTSVSVFYGEIVTESVKIKKWRGSWKMLEMEFKFSKISSKNICLRLSKPTA